MRRQVTEADLPETVKSSHRLLNIVADCALSRWSRGGDSNHPACMAAACGLTVA